MPAITDRSLDSIDLDTEARPPLDGLARRYGEVRSFTERLCRPLATEDYVVQTMRDVSPTKWHLAHVTWFFETFILSEHYAGYTPFHPEYAYLFNSYYLNAGERHCRDQRGYISRPTVAEVYAYREHVDEHMERLMAGASEGEAAVLAPLVELGIQHEQQHQELLLTDIKHVLSVNPMRPAYRAPQGPAERGAREPDPLRWVAFGEGLRRIGHPGLESGFCYDNETPRHRHFVDAFELADRLVTNAEYLEFMRDGGYRRGDLWLSEGWAVARERDWSEPFYWEERDGGWWSYTLAGLRPIDPAEPVCHLSYFEADAYARWAGYRLPTEQEWEVAAGSAAQAQGNFVESGELHPRPAPPAAADEDGPRLRQMFGDVWEWTRSQYSPYPGYEPLPGTLGEYNGKFMSNQFVLRGGSCATSRTHIRATYRNFFPADATWQFMGVRLARDAS
ncbi:MAG: ergothioneine biosynthesis protein EgtB [Gemmatimonadota bacterium]|nr:ergothioneine biosynthesis protein EgtB [Gemmatimonadota bacterium]